jgi:hypothetical protein
MKGVSECTVLTIALAVLAQPVLSGSLAGAHCWVLGTHIPLAIPARHRVAKISQQAKVVPTLLQKERAYISV